jgi:hypothetical protein
MKSTPHVTVHDLPLTELRARSNQACQVLRDARTSAAQPLARRDRTGGLRVIAEAIDATERLLPGSKERPRTLLARTLRDLTANERRVLREVIEGERAARERLVRLIGDIPLEQAEEALDRIEVQESVAAELSALWRLFEQASVAPAVA